MTLGEDAAVRYLESTDGLIMLQDDYPAWRRAGYVASAGKPVWLGTPGVHHIFFDDNFRPWTDNSILALRRRGRVRVRG